MRTVSFSNRKVQNLLNNNFVNTFSNTTGDPTAGMSINHAPGDRAGNCVRGNGKQNVQTLFLTPEGDIFHAATGFLSSPDIVSEILFAGELFKQIEESDDATETVVNQHRMRLSDEGFTADQIDDQSPLAAMRMMSSQMGQSMISGMSSGNMRNRRPDPFAAFSKMQFFTDNKFSIQNPLLNIEDFESDPTKLVGNGKSFFASSSSSNN